jgi:NAD(P)-dependent dehydrogenase (short-subunit alcohol dehydrogenase family)
MTSTKTWLITGAGRGMGLHIAKAALAVGHNVVATGRNPDAVREALGPAHDLLAVKLDVTSPEDADAAVKRVVDRFGGIDVLVNTQVLPHGATHQESTNYATPSVEDYFERNAAQREFWETQNGQQSGDPAELAQALLTIADEEEPPRRLGNPRTGGTLS